MSMRIAIYGATGYAGRLVTAEAVRRGIPAVLVGRSLDRLRAAAESAGAHDAHLRVAELDDEDALAAALQDVDVVINTASPFTSFGEPVARAAVAAGTHYVDISGEELYIKRVLDTLGEEAQAAGVTLLPAANNDCLTGDLLGHLVADGLGELETISIAFDAREAEGSRGTVLMAYTTQEVFRSGGLTWDQGEYVEGLAAKRSSVRWPGDEAETPAVKFPLPPAVSIPRHVATRHSEGLSTPLIAGFFSDTSQELVDSMPVRQGPSPAARARARFFLVADATAVDGRRRRGVIEARDMYGTTAVIAVEAARRIVESPRPGAWSPAEVLEPRSFLDALATHGLTWRVEEPAGA